MECIVGIQGPDFVLLASDTSASRSVVSMKQDCDKMFKLGDHVCMLACGESGDTVQFAEYIAKNIQLYKMINGYELSPHATASFTRAKLAEALRKNPYQVNMLVGGYDDTDGPSLYYMDYLASINRLPFAIHGYGSFFGLSILDRLYKPDLSQDDAVRLLEGVVKEISHRFIINLPAFKVRIIDTTGVKDLPDIKITKAI